MSAEQYKSRIETLAQKCFQCGKILENPKEEGGDYVYFCPADKMNVRVKKKDIEKPKALEKEEEKEKEPFIMPGIGIHEIPDEGGFENVRGVEMPMPKNEEKLSEELLLEIEPELIEDDKND